MRRGHNLPRDEGLGARSPSLGSTLVSAIFPTGHPRANLRASLLDSLGSPMG